eukprot:TRINITY_DN1304_c0_g1_i2.p1 TRINITY_DN1304_c0_g1~~TRINITY_DN1304_c0_g1_i2.p1  ORF type:complete len:420 (+),score=204.03 TRINITY_DN1304_c0_g1_i2:63-1262(+)
MSGPPMSSSMGAQLMLQKRKRAEMEQAEDEHRRREELAALLLEKKMETIYQMVPAGKLKAQRAVFDIPEWCGKPAAGAHLTVRKGDLSETVMVDVSPYYLFGRNVDVCDVPLEHPSISRVHCAVIHHESGSVYVMDLGAAHGTFLGDARLAPKKPVRFKEGVDLRLGASSRVYRLHLTTPVLKRPKTSDAAAKASAAASSETEQQRLAQEKQEREQAARAAAEEINRRKDKGGAVHKAKADFWGGAAPTTAAAAAAAAGKDAAAGGDDAADAAGPVKLSHILIRHAESAEPFHPATGAPVTRSLDAAADLAARVKQSVLVDLDGRGTAHAFAKAAKKHSECLSGAQKKGVLGKVGGKGFLAELCPQEVHAAGVALAEDAVSDPVESEDGVHIVYRHVNA